MAQSSEHSEPATLLLTISKHDTIKIGLPPKREDDNFHKRAQVLGKMAHAHHVISSPSGELFCVGRHGDLYRGPLPANKEDNWFSKATKVGKSEWRNFKFVFFHPNGELYGATEEGELYKGPQPTNENVPWMTEQATALGGFHWKNYEALFFDLSGNLFALGKHGIIMKGKPLTQADYENWETTAKMFPDNGWYKHTEFMSFCPDGYLWSVNKKGNIFRSIMVDNGENIEYPEKMGKGYDDYSFLSFTKDNTISSIISFEFLIERGKILSDSPEYLENKKYSNFSGDTPLKHTFT
ncbi:tachylectin-2-like [Dendropsophus ebraccatus]|uniref:tachylectin-2-like n=1 Tax=Dendropsophus ebraccatus TaxID=150705 RepID=UPI003831EDFE